MRPANDEELRLELDRRMAGYGNGARMAVELDEDARRLRYMRSGAMPISRRVAKGLGYELRWVRITKTGK